MCARVTIPSGDDDSISRFLSIFFAEGRETRKVESPRAGNKEKAEDKRVAAGYVCTCPPPSREIIQREESHKGEQ